MGRHKFRSALRQEMQRSGWQAAAVVPWYLSGGILAANCIAAYQPKGAASLAASYVNLANPGTYDAAPGTAPTWAAGTGWTFNGTTQYLTTGIVPAATFTIIAQFSGASLPPGNYPQPVGQNTTGAVNNISNGGVIPFPGGNHYFSWGGAATTVAGGLAAGNLALAGNQGYLNGVADGAAVGGGYGVATRGLFIGARNSNAGAAEYWYAGNIQAVAIYDVTLTAPQVAAVAAAMAAL